MGKGRAPCCDKNKVKRGPWSPAEDSGLISFIQKHGHSNWRALPKQAGLLRCGKSCRLRWINYLRPDVKRGNFSPEEEKTIINLHKSMGNKWSKIASHLPGRTDNEIKNVWNTHLKKKLTNRGDGAPCRHTESKDSLTSYSTSPSPSSSSCISYGDLNLGKGPGEDQDQEGQQSKIFYPLPTTVSVMQCKSIDGAKQESVLPNHSNASNVTAPSQLQPTTTKEKTKDRVADEITEIPLPLESDVDFWNMFDESLDPKESNIVSQPQEYHELFQRSSLGEGHEEEVEYKKWLRYLENELGLVGGNDSDRALKGEDHQHQQLVTESAEKEMMSGPETDPDMAYFPMWLSPPQNFDF